MDFVMRGHVLAFLMLPALANLAWADDVDLRALLERLDRLEKQNERLEKKNQDLESQLDSLRVSQKTPAAPAAVEGKSPHKTESAKDVKQLVEEILKDQAERRKAEEKKKEDAGFVVGKNMKMEASWKNGLWFENADKSFKWTVGGVSQFDLSFFGAPSELVESIGVFNNLVEPSQALNDGMQFRRARLRFAGQLWEQIEFWAQYEFAQAIDLRRRTLGISPVPAPGVNPVNDLDPNETVGFNEVYVGINQLPLVGQVRVGRHRESLNFITATSDNNQVWLERGLMFDAFNGDYNFSNGITLARTYADDRVYTLVGFFQQNATNNKAFANTGDGDYVYDGRLTCLPIYDELSQLWVHLGADYSYRNLYQDQVRYRARPMVRTGSSFQTPNIVNTGTLFSADAQQIANLEFAMAYGRLTFAGEYAYSWVTNASTGGKLGTPGAKARGTYEASGGYVEALFFLTPDHRGYRKDRPGYERVYPRRTFYLLDGEHGMIFSAGAWEVGMRYDYVDLTHGGVNGGMANAVTWGLNWYLNPNFRVQTNYFLMNRIFSPSDNAGRLEGDIQGLGIRFNLDY